MNETWNTCPDCGDKWKDETPTPQVMHRTRLCDKCASDSCTETGKATKAFNAAEVLDQLTKLLNSSRELTKRVANCVIKNEFSIEATADEVEKLKALDAEWATLTTAIGIERYIAIIGEERTAIVLTAVGFGAKVNVITEEKNES